MAVKNEYLNLYLECEIYFIEDLGFKPLRQAPDIILRRKKVILEKQLPKYRQKSFWSSKNDSTTLLLSTTAKQIALTKAITVRECLLSFFPQEIRSNPVIYAFVYRRLLLAKNPLNTPQKKALDEFFKSAMPSLEQDSSLEDLLHRNYTALEIYLPMNRIEVLFKKYSYSLANLREFISENDFVLPDVILTDIWEKTFFSMFKTDEFHLFFEMVRLFKKLGEPYSLQALKDHIRKISVKNLKNKEFGEILTVWQNDLSKIDEPYLSLSNRSAAFAYRINWGSLDINIFYFMLRFNKSIKKEIIDFALKHMRSLVFSRERLFDESVIKYGFIRCRTQDYNIFNEFLDSLKINHVVDEYIFIEIKRFEFNLNIQNKKDRKNSFHMKTFIDYETNKKILKPDIIDFTILEMLSNNYIGLKVDFERTDFFIENLKNKLRTAESQIKIQFDNFKKMREINVNIQDIKILVPFKIKVNRENVQLKYLMDLISKKFGDLGVKFIYDNLFIIFSISIDFFKGQDRKLEGFDGIKEFLDLNLLNIKDPESYILLKQSFSSLDIFFHKADKVFNFKNWIFNTLLFMEKNQEKYKEILDILQKMRDYLNTINFSNQKGNLTLIIEALTKYLKQTKNEIHIDMKNRIKKMKEYNLLIPDMYGSISFPNLYIPKVLLLTNVGIDDRRIQVISKQFPYMLFLFSQNSNSKYIFIEIWAHSDLNKMIYDTIRYLFKGDLVFFTTLHGQLYGKRYNHHSFYNFQTKSFDSLKPNFDSIKNFLLYFKNNVDYPEKIFKISDNYKISTDWNKSKNFIYNSIRNKIKPVLKENYIKNNEKNRRLAKIIHDTEKEFTMPFNIPKNHEFKYSALKYRGFPNFGHFNMSFYLVQTTILKNMFSIKESKTEDTKKFLLVPGFSKIRTSTDLGPFQEMFIEYITPQEDPPVKIFNYALRRKIISEFRVMRILKMHVNFNPTYFYDEIWTPYFGIWDKLAKKIITNSKYRFNPEFQTFDFISTKDKTFGKESIEFETAVKSFENSLRLKFTGEIKKMIDIGIIIPIPKFNLNELQLDERVMLFLGKINEDQKNKIMMIFSMLPQVNIFEIDYYDSDNIAIRHSGLFLELNLPNSRLDQLYFSIYDLIILLDIKEFEFIPSVIELTPQEFTSGKIKKRLNPLQSHLWSKRTKRWNKVRYFGKEGVPLNYQERIKQLQ